MPLTQDNRNISIATPLGKDVLLLRSFSYAEQLGRLFQLEAELLSEKADINFDQIVGKNVTVRLEAPSKKTRFFNGFVSRFLQVPAEGQHAQYRATIVPWLWFLTRGADCRIFQKKTVPEIIKQVFRDEGFTDFRESLTGKHEQWDFCVQYRETNFNFVSRLMEQEGIYYFFEHANQKHTLVLADAMGAHKPAAGYEKLPFRGVQSGVRETEYISQWVLEQEIQPGAYALTDFNFEKPRTSLLGKSEESRAHEQSKFEIFDYPGEYDQPGDASTLSRIRIEELQTQHLIARGQSNACGLSAGATFTLQYFPRADRNKQYLITSASLQASGDDFEGNSDGGGGDFFSCNLTAIDAKQQFRPARITPKPLIQGPQTAIVTGTKGEEIYTDPDGHGRVKVQFHWDRYGKADENSSCWLRVSQAGWAGKNWGMMSIPRIGQEVIVEFLEGDPDCPIVTGRVYNGNSMPPYKLPDEKTKTTMKSNSSKGGQGFNELRFEDLKSKEQVFIHAERNMDVRVKKDSLEYIGENRHLVVKKDQFESVTGDVHLDVKGEQNQKIGETLSINAGQNIQEKAGMRIAAQAGQEIHLKAGMNVIIEAGMSITLKAGGGFITVGPAGVAISGTPVLINSGGAAGSGSGSSPTPPKAALEADKSVTGTKNEAATRTPARKKPTSYGPTAATLKQAAKNGTPFCEQCAKAAAAG